MFNILMVEDNPQHADLAMRILQTAGYEVTHAPRGKVGIELARKQSFALIMMDLELPDMTGQTACMIIGKYLGATTPPIMAVTGYDSAAYRESARRAGCKAFLSKPYPPPVLLQTIRHFLEESSLVDRAALL